VSYTFCAASYFFASARNFPVARNRRLRVSFRPAPANLAGSKIHLIDADAKSHSAQRMEEYRETKQDNAIAVGSTVRFRRRSGSE
jgi:hypothetical protein